MKKSAGTINLTPDWEGIAPAIIYGLKHTEDIDKTWEDSVKQLATIADDYKRLVKEGKITQEDTEMNLSNVKMEE